MDEQKSLARMVIDRKNLTATEAELLNFISFTTDSVLTSRTNQLGSSLLQLQTDRHEE